MWLKKTQQNNSLWLCVALYELLDFEWQFSRGNALCALLPSACSVISHLLLLTKTTGKWIGQDFCQNTTEEQPQLGQEWDLLLSMSQPVTTEVTPHAPQCLWYAPAHRKQNLPNCSPLSLGLYSASKVNQKVKQPVSKTRDWEERMPKVCIHAPFCMTWEQLQPCEPKMWPCRENTGQPGHTHQLPHRCQTQATVLPHAAASFGPKSTLLIYWQRYITWSP